VSTAEVNSYKQVTKNNIPRFRPQQVRLRFEPWKSDLCYLLVAIYFCNRCTRDIASTLQCRLHSPDAHKQEYQAFLMFEVHFIETMFEVHFIDVWGIKALTRFSADACETKVSVTRAQPS
jgi:hypothetical protein